MTSKKADGEIVDLTYPVALRPSVVPLNLLYVEIAIVRTGSWQKLDVLKSVTYIVL